jgi:hypothetical protein
MCRLLDSERVLRKKIQGSSSSTTFRVRMTSSFSGVKGVCFVGWERKRTNRSGDWVRAYIPPFAKARRMGHPGLVVEGRRTDNSKAKVDKQTTKTEEQTTAKTNAGVLRCAQNDNFFNSYR